MWRPVAAEQVKVQDLGYGEQVQGLVQHDNQVQSLRNGIPRIKRLVNVEWNHYIFISHFRGFHCQCINYAIHIELQQVSCPLYFNIGSNFNPFLTMF